MAIVEAVKPVTADELFRLPRSERYELVKGALVKMSPPPGYEHGRIIMRLALRIGNHVAAKDLGDVLAAETGFRLARDPDTVRAADLAFVTKARRPARPPQGYVDLAPDLVVEVVSPSDDPDKIQAKIKDWLDAGTRLVLVVYPGSRQIAVYRSLREITILTEGDTFSAEDILPGFVIPAAEIFSSPAAA
jgi:Uma2 family endonuclease